MIAKQLMGVPSLFIIGIWENIIYTEYFAHAFYEQNNSKKKPYFNSDSQVDKYSQQECQQSDKRIASLCF